MELTAQDNQLIQKATEIIKKHFAVGKHRVGTAILTTTGEIITAINMEGSFGCNDICAEQITLGKALSEGFVNISCIVSVKHPKPEEQDQSIKVASPCGRCRELLFDYAAEAEVIVREGDMLLKAKAKDLIPYRYSKK